MKIRSLIFLCLISVGLFAQKDNKTPLYTFCGKPGLGAVSFKGAELKELKKELIPVTSGDKIKSYNVSMNVNGAQVSFQVTGNYHAQLNEMIDGCCTRKEDSKFLIEKVLIIRGDKIIKAPGVVVEIDNTN